MPFEVFRRHQRKLLAICGILAMFGFVVSDSLPRLLNSGAGPRDQKVVELHSGPVYQSQLNEMARQRNRANLFVGGLSPYMPREVFGGLKTRDLVDALVLQKEADRLGVPATPEMGRRWLREITDGKMNGELFNLLYSRFSNEVSEDQLLTDIANQVRLMSVRRLLGRALVTPYDVYRLYRDQNERVSAKAAEVPVEQFLAKVPEPSVEEVQALYEKYKDVLPDPARETPGFKIPRRVQAEVLSIDGTALARGVRDQLKEPELRTYYENHKAEFEVPSEFPTDLFAGQPELTPPVIQPFADVREIIAPRVAEERAQAEIGDKFLKIKEEEMIPFADRYLSALDEQEEAKKQGAGAKAALPEPKDLKPVADRERLDYEKTDLMSREEAERHGQVAGAEVGLTPLSGGRKFAEDLFDAKTGLYEPIELTDILGRRFLVRKVRDEPAHVAPLDQVRAEVVRAWKMDRARPLAQKAAEELAQQLQSKGEALKEPKSDDYRVVAIPPITRTHTSFLPTATMFDAGTVTDTPIPQVPQAGEAFREAYFNLKAGEPAVAPNQPKTIYYVLSLDRREPVSFASLYAPNSDEFRYQRMAQERALRRLDESWMSWLRQQAGIKSDWVPPDEAKKAAAEG